MGNMIQRMMRIVKCLVSFKPSIMALFLAAVLSLNSHSFGFQSKPETKELHITSFSYALIGVIFSKTSSSLAVLQNKANGKTVMITIGDTLCGRELVQVLDQGIILEKQGETHLILLGRSELVSLAEATKKHESSSDSIRQSDDIIVDRQLNNGAQRKKFIKSEIEHRVKQEWTIIMKETRLIPHYSNGKMSGVKVISMPKAGVISEIGIHRNDVIRAVNGVEIDDFSTLISLFNEVSIENRFEVLIERNGKLFRHIFILE